MVSDPRTFLATELNAQSTSQWTDEMYMSRALRLAWQAAGQTHPNPLVGGVVVTGGEIVGEGYHHRCGGAHAEVVALERAGDRARGGTVYVTLEPCAHEGRTPPCVERVIDAGVGRVVIPTIDPDKMVRGQGVKALRGAGIRVDIGCAEKAAIATNIGYYKHRLGLGPTVVLKMALTIDGMIASKPGRRDRVTGEAAHRYVHRLRANSDGIVVGLDTIRSDNPRLDCRLAECGTPPVPVVLDGKLEMPSDNRWSRDKRPYVVVGGRPGAEASAAHEAGGGRVLPCAGDDHGWVDVEDAVRALAKGGLDRLLIEGGAKVFTSFVRAGVWDALFLFHSPGMFGTEGVPVYSHESAETPDALSVDAVQLENDFLHRYLNRRTCEEITSRLREEKGV
jgi:diaminohydroxyphosphoribosylaminopyrimidine deaminase/5-amino-6-(5-phosphoribosylamino)uracil reductase